MAVSLSDSGKILEQSAETLLRIWRLARAASRRQVFPGLLDGLMGEFLTTSGRILSAGGPPEDVWREVTGLVRWAPENADKEITHEWAIAMEVLAAACESFDAEVAVAGWLARAVAEAEKGTTTLRDRAREAPQGVVTVLLFGDLRPPKRMAGDDERS